jgi:hypothetical protein
MPDRTPTFEEMQNHILTKAAQDGAFRRALLAGPKAALQAELASKFPGFPGLPDGLEIKAVEQTKNTVYLVLPPAEPETEVLGDEQLEAVAGGGNWGCATYNTCRSTTCIYYLTS